MPDEQILAQATLEKNPIPSGGALSADQQRAKDIRTKMGEGKGLSAFDAAISASQRVDAGARARTLDANFGIDRDPASGAKTRNTTTEPDSQARYDRAQKALQQTEEILSVGLTTDRDVLLANLESAMSVLPGYNDYLSTINDPNIRRGMVEDLLKDPRLMEKIRAGHDRVTAESARLKDEVTDAKKKADEAEAARVKKEAERDAVSGRGGKLEQARTADLSFRDITTAGARGTELKALQEDAAGNSRDLDAEERDAAANRTRARNSFDSRSRRLAQIEADPDKGPTSGDYAAAKNELDAAQITLNDSENAFAQAKRDRSRRTELEKEDAELPRKIKQLEADEIRLIGEYSDAEKAALIARADLNSKQVDRAAAEEAYASNAERVVSDALRDHLREQMHAANEANRALIDKEIADAQTQADADMLRMIKQRYLSLKPGKKGSFDVIVDDSKARVDVGYLLSGRADATPAKMVEQALNAAYPGDPTKVAELKGKPDFVARYGAEIAKNAFIQYVQSGGKLSEGQQLYIEAQPWGQNMIEQIYNSPQLKAKEQKLIEEGKLPAGGFREAAKAKSKDGRSILSWLLMGATIASLAVPFYGLYKASTMPLGGRP